MAALGGFGQGFSSGMQAGAEQLAARARMKAVQQEQIDQKLEYYSTAANSVIKNIQETIAGAPQRDANLDQTVAAMQAHVDDTIKGISQFGDKGRVLAMALSNSLSQAVKTPTMSEAASNKLQGELQGKMNFVDQQFGQQPQTGAQQPMAPQPQAPGQQPMMLGPDTGASPGAQPAPAAPMAPAQGESPEQTAAAVQQYAQAQPQPQVAMPQQGGGISREQMRQRALESVIPSTDLEKQQHQELAKQQATQMTSVRKEGQEGFSRSRKALELLDKGIISGFGAEYRLAGRKAMNKFSDDAGLAARTEEFQRELFEAASLIISRFGSGTGVSNTDWENAKKIAGGDINLEPEALRSIITSAMQQQVKMVQEWNAQAPSDMQVKSPVPMVRSETEYNSLKKGDLYIDPNGQLKTKAK